MANKTSQFVKCITISSSDDENDCMPKIIDTVSLQGTKGSTPKKYEVFNEQPRRSIGIPKPKFPEQAAVIRKPVLRQTVLSTTNAKEYKRINPTTVQVTKKPEVTVPVPDNNDSTELFKKFRNACQRLGTSSAVTTKICDKVARAYSVTNPEYISSESFKTLLRTSIQGILNSSGTKPWHIVRSVVDELKHHKLSKKNKKPPDLEKTKTDAKYSPGEGTSRDVAGCSKEAANEENKVAEEESEDEIEDPKKRRQVRKLCNALRKLDHKIRHLEEKDIGLDEMDEDSHYIKLDRYKAHFTKVYKKYCELSNKPSDAERIYLRKVSFAGSPYPEINRCLELFYNKNREFPDFQDVKKLVQTVNVTKKMKWPPIKVHDIAEKTFKDFGEMLKRMRQYDDYEVMSSYMTCKDDPAKDNSELRQKLQENATLSKKKEQEVIDSFVNKQMERIDQTKGTDSSDSVTESSEEGTDSENEKDYKGYRTSPETAKNNVEPFKDDFKSDEETMGDPKSNFTTYLKLKPRLVRDSSEDIVTKDGEEMKDDGTKERIVPNENNNEKYMQIKGVKLKDFKQHNDILSKENTLLSGDEFSEEDNGTYTKQKKNISSNQPREDEKENLGIQEYDKLRDLNVKEEKRRRNRIKMMKYLDDVISSDDSSKRRKIKLSIDSSDDEIESIKKSEKDTLPKSKNNVDEINENCMQKTILEHVSDDEKNISTNLKLPEDETCTGEKKENIEKRTVNEKEEHSQEKEEKINEDKEGETKNSEFRRGNIVDSEKKMTESKHRDEDIIDSEHKREMMDSKDKEKNVLSSKHKEMVIDWQNSKKNMMHSEDKKENMIGSEDKKENVIDSKYKHAVTSIDPVNNFLVCKLSDENSSVKSIKNKVTLLSSDELSDGSQSENNRKQKRKIELSIDDSSEYDTDSKQDRQKITKKYQRRGKEKSFGHEITNKQNKEKINKKDGRKKRKDESSTNESSESETSHEQGRRNICKEVNKRKRKIELVLDDSSESETSHEKNRGNINQEDNKKKRKMKLLLDDCSEYETDYNKQNIIKKDNKRKRNDEFTTDETSEEETKSKCSKEKTNRTKKRKKKENDSSVDDSSEDEINSVKTKEKINDQYTNKLLDSEYVLPHKKIINLNINKESREKINEVDENEILDQEYILPQSKMKNSNERTKKVRTKKKIVITPDKIRNIKHKNNTESGETDEFYKISVQNVHGKKTTIKSKSNNPPGSLVNASQSVSNTKKIDNKPGKYECESPSIVSCNSSERNDNIGENEKSVASSRLKKGEKEEVNTDCNLKTDAIVDNPSTSKIKENEDMELKLSISSDSSEEKEVQIALEDSDYGIEEKEDSDYEFPTKFIINKSVLQDVSKVTSKSVTSKCVVKRIKSEKKLITANAEKKTNEGENSDSQQSDDSERTPRNKHEDNHNSDLDESVVIISEDVLEEHSQNKTSRNASKDTNESLLGLKYGSSVHETKSNSCDSDSDSDSDLKEAIKLCEVNISDSEPEALNIDDESSDLSDSNANKPTQVLQQIKKRKEPIPDLCIIMESVSPKHPAIQRQRPVVPMKPFVQDLVAKMPVRKQIVNPLVRPSANPVARCAPITRPINTGATVRQLSVNPTPVLKPSTATSSNLSARPTCIRSFNPTFNRRTGFNPLFASTPIQQPQQRFNRNTVNKVNVDKPSPSVIQRQMFRDSGAKVSLPIRPSKPQVPQLRNSVQDNRKIINGVQRNTNNRNRPQIIRRPQNASVPAEEDVIVLD